jgi:hypothetical protein
LVAPGILTELTDRKRRSKRRGTSTLICYVDQTDPQRELELIPCRMATLVEAVALGRTVSLQLEVASFAFATDIALFNEEVNSLGVNLVPRRVDDKIRGTYWFEITQDLKSTDQSDDLATWEGIVEQLAIRPDFKDERFFYNVEGLVDVGPDQPLEANANLYRLRPSREYDLRIYHFHPAEGDSRSVIGLETSHPSLTFTTNPHVLVDSRYDLKRMRFRTMAPASRELGVLTVRRQLQGESTWEWEFDLPIQVRGSFWRKLGLGLIIGVFLAVPPIVSDPNLLGGSQLATPVSAISAILAGIAAAFGLRRSL